MTPSAGIRVDAIVERLVTQGIDAHVHGDGGVVVADMSHSADNVSPAALHACIVGRRFDGHDFAAQAIAAGAAALLVERLLDGIDRPQVVVPDVRAAIGPTASMVFDDPSAHLDVIGITGTNGKTTTAAMVDAIMTSAGRTCMVMGTLSGGHTTPEAPELHRRLAAGRADGVDTVIMEVSSHALVEGRVRGVDFDVVAFTNLGRDHLDLHGTQEEYFRAKSLLFTDYGAPHAVICVDDRHGRLLADTLADRAEVEVLTVDAATMPVRSIGPDIVTMCIDGVSVALSPTGYHNAANARVAVGIARCMGIDTASAARGLATMGTVAGRMERIDGPSDDLAVVVDYAHTPDALAAVLDAVRHMTSTRVHLVFGCGGERDRDKRPEMGRVAAAADVVVVTSDNPRSEDPDAIIDEVMAGVEAAKTSDVRPVVTRRITDRVSAIRRTIADADAGDVVLIAGRGHEQIQSTADGEIDLDDRDEARQAMEARR
jgi:UDP-N-acetylmuramoyl-L-alanyl-D-glutamate--2,6-diaminopimelate ligase